MHEIFVPLDEFLRPAHASPPAKERVDGAPPGESLRDAASVREAEPPGKPSAGQGACAFAESAEYEAALDEALADIRRFRAALADALDAKVEALLGEIAASVLGRDLRVAPLDVRAIVERELALAGGVPLRVRAHPGECAALHGVACAVVADASLRRGDVMLDLRAGTIDATLGCRLERALHGVAAT
jgi:flagellar biosynthesis/type III secretory pathway protein FliH